MAQHVGAQQLAQLLVTVLLLVVAHGATPISSIAARSALSP